jgi:hypothetical protein
LTTDQITHGQLCLAKFEAAQKFLELNPEAVWKQIRKETGVTPVQFCRWKKAIAKVQAGWADGATLPRSALVEALARKSPPGRKPKYALTETEASKVAAHNLQSNRTSTAGSPQEALRHAIKRGEVRAGLANALLQRENEGKPILTESMRRQVQVSEATVRADRTPRNTWLDLVQSPGSLQLTIDEDSGEEVMIEPGFAETIDDATINLPCCVPLERRGDPCWEKFGVMAARFQFILVADHASYFLPCFSYTARPRSSYRAEDLTATMHIGFREYGIPRWMYMEHGVSKARLVHETLSKAGVKIKHVKSPHQKVVEGIFNKLWTKLSFLPGQVGRHLGDDEETTKLLMACRRGEQDPRKYFLMLDDVVKALREVIAEHNAGWINHSRYGRWIPQELWSAKAPKILRPLDPEAGWMFAPVVSVPLTVKGFTVKTTVRLMDGLSQVFHFGAEWLKDFHGSKVKLFFNPFLDAPAKVVLAEDFRGTKAESILGDAEMIDRHARHNLRKLVYGSGPDGQSGFPDIGLQAARQHAQALRRAVVSVRPDGKPGIIDVESRSIPHHLTMVPVASAGAGAAISANTAPAPAEKFLRRKTGLGVEQDEFEAQSARLARDEARAAQRVTTTIEDE